MIKAFKIFNSFFNAGANRMLFSSNVKQIEQKSAEITASLTDLDKTQSKSVVVTSGRPWKAAELRLKSTQDLHKLWFVCVREKNLVLADKIIITANKPDRMIEERGRRVEKTMARILSVIQERELIKKQFRKRLEEQYIEKKKKQLQTQVSQQPQPLPQITWEIMRAKYHELRKGVDNVNYLHKIFDPKEEHKKRQQRAEERVKAVKPGQTFTSYWEKEMTIGERPTQMEILKEHVSNWKSLNLRQRRIILGHINARRAKDAKASFTKQLKILGQKIAYDQARLRVEIPQDQPNKTETKQLSRRSIKVNAIKQAKEAKLAKQALLAAEKQAKKSKSAAKPKQQPKQTPKK